MILDAASVLAWTWPAAHKALRKELKKLGEEAPVQSLDAVVELLASAAVSGGEARTDASALRHERRRRAAKPSALQVRIASKPTPPEPARRAHAESTPSDEAAASLCRQFQPFLRFNGADGATCAGARYIERFQPFLRFNLVIDFNALHNGISWAIVFQPFLRFNGSCVQLLWVFKFFLGFFVFSAVGLDQRFTFISLGVGQRRGAILRRLAKAKTREKRRRSTPFFAVGSFVGGGFVSRVGPSS